MTKKDYELIANVIKTNINYSLVTKSQKKAIENLAHDLGHSLRLENPKFNTYIFERACGITNN